MEPSALVTKLSRWLSALGTKKRLSIIHGQRLETAVDRRQRMDGAGTKARFTCWSISRSARCLSAAIGRCTFRFCVLSRAFRYFRPTACSIRSSFGPGARTALGGGCVKARFPLGGTQHRVGAEVLRDEEFNSEVTLHSEIAYCRYHANAFTQSRRKAAVPGPRGQ